jgi:hypothetical protein
MQKARYCFYAFSAISALYTGRNVKAQYLVSDEKHSISVGAEGGWMRNIQSGSFKNKCQCPFTNASGNSGAVSMFIEFETSKFLSFGMNLGIDTKYISTSKSVIDTATITFSANNNIAAGSFAFDRNDHATVTYFFASPYIKITPFAIGLYFKVSPELGYLTSSNFIDSRSLNTQNIVLYQPNRNDSITLTNVRFQNGTSSETLQNSTIDGVNKLRVALLFGVGYDIPLINNFSLLPEASYNWPLTNVSNSPQSANWKISSFAVTLGARYRF